MELRIRLLGPVELQVDEDARSALRNPKDGLVLAALAWDVGRTVSIGTLIDRVWDSPPGQPRESLHVYVARIRKALQRYSGPKKPLIHTRAHTYTLDVPPGSIDVHRYLDLTTRARGHADQGRLREAELCLQEAGALWRGEPLAGLDGAWAGQIREVLAQRRLHATVTRAGIALRLRHYDDALAELLALPGQYPTDERLAEHTALALFASGRASDADQEVERVGRALHRELGSGLGPRLRRVRQAIADQTPVDEVLTALGYPAVAAPSRHQLPTGPDDLPPDIDYVGRQAEVDEIIAVLARRREGGVQAPAMVGIDGMAGAGKTVMAVHIAHRLKEHYPDGRLMIDLRGHDGEHAPLSTAHVLTELLRRLGEPPGNEEQLVTVWRTVMAGRRVLLLLDNAAGPEQVRSLLPGASNSLVIATSRHRLAALPGLYGRSLDVLPAREAIALFEDRIRGRRTAEPSEIARVASLTGYLPLALDIVAARFLTRPSWSLTELVSRLSHGRGILHEIRDGTRAVAAAFELSYQALSESGQSVFRHLGLLVGREFGPHATAALSGLSLDDAESELEILFHVHLVREGAARRFVLHDLLREFARTLAGSLPPSESRAALDRLSDAYLIVADRADRLAYPHRVRIDVDVTSPVELAGWLDESEPHRWFHTESENLLALVEHLREEADLRRSALFSHVLAGFLGTDGRHLSSFDEPLREAAAYWSEQNSPLAEARALIDLSAATAQDGRYAESLTTARRALALAEAQKERDVLMEALQRLAMTLNETGRHHDALPLVRRLIPLRQRYSDLHQQTRAINLLGAVQFQAGELGAALTTFQEALSGFRSIKDTRGQYMALSNVATILRTMNLLDESIAYFQEALSISDGSGKIDERMLLKMNLANTLQKTGDASTALSLYQEALPVFRSLKETHNESAVLIGIGRALTALGRPAEAIPHHLAALELASALDVGPEQARGLQELGRSELRAGLLGRSTEHLHQSLAVARRLKLGFIEVETLEVLAELHESQGDQPRATRLREEARARSQSLGVGAGQDDTPDAS